MITPHPLDRERVTIKLETFRLLTEFNQDLLDSNPIVKEQIIQQIQMVERYLSELDTCQQAGDQSRYEAVLDSASFTLDCAGDLLKNLLEQ